MGKKAQIKSDFSNLLLTEKLSSWRKTLPDTGNELGKVPDHFVVIDILVAELLFIVKVVLQSPFDFRKTYIEHGFTTQYPFIFGNVAIPESSCELENAFKNTPVDRSQAGGGKRKGLFIEQCQFTAV